ncbi:hypothetical protein P8452_14000 [Trifolium repens]|nr:hypothetical protein P8452_14000 [Trifolium repens]
MEFSRSPYAHAPATIQGGVVTPSGVIRKTLIFSTPARHGTGLSASRCGGVGKIDLHIEFSRSPYAHAPTRIQGGVVTPSGVIRKTLIFSTPARHGTGLSASRCGGVGKIGLHMEFSRSPYAHAPTTIQGGVVTPSGVIRKTLIFSTPARHGTGLSASRCGGVGKIDLHMEFSRSPYAHAPTTIQGGVVTPSGVIRKTLIFPTPARHGTGLSASRCGGVGKIGLYMEFSRSPYAHAPTTIQGGVVTPSGVIRKTLIFSTPACHGTGLSASRCGGMGKIDLHMEFSRSPYAHAPTTIQGGVATPSGVIRKTLIFSTPARRGTGLSASRCGGVGKIGLHMEFSRSPYAHAPTTIQGGVVIPSGVIRKALIFSTPARHGTGLSASKRGGVGKIGLHMEFSCSTYAHAPTTIQGGVGTPSGVIRKTLIFSTPARHGKGLSASRCGGVGKIDLHIKFFTFSICTRSYHDTRRCRDTFRCNSENFDFFDPRTSWHGA